MIESPLIDKHTETPTKDATSMTTLVFFSSVFKQLFCKLQPFTYKMTSGVIQTLGEKKHLQNLLISGALGRR